MIFDVLSSDISQAGELDFTVDNTVLEVAVNPPAGAGLAFENANNVSWFEPGDNINLRAISTNIPFGFGQGTGRHRINLLYSNGIGLQINIPELARSGWVTLPSLCEGFSFPGDGLFLTVPKTNGRVQIVIAEVELNVAQIGAPDDLNGEDIFVQYHLELVHTKPLEASA